jgi:hypothetical protein
VPAIRGRLRRQGDCRRWCRAQPWQIHLSPRLSPQRGHELYSGICGRSPRRIISSAPGCPVLSRRSACRSPATATAAPSSPRLTRATQPRELRPRRIRVTGIDVIGPLEAFDGFRDRRGAPSEIPDAPAHHEVDVLPAARVGDDAAVRGGNLQFRWLLSGEWLAARRAGMKESLSVRGYGGSITIEGQYALVMRIASRSSTRDSRSTFSCAVRTERSEIATEARE